MKIPKQIKIGGHICKIIFRDRVKEDGIDHLGSYNVRCSKIWIANDLTKSQQESTFLHEIIEAIDYCNQLELNHKQITTLEHNLYQVLKDNKLLK